MANRGHAPVQCSSRSRWGSRLRAARGGHLDWPPGALRVVQEPDLAAPSDQFRAKNSAPHLWSFFFGSTQPARPSFDSSALDAAESGFDSTKLVSVQPRSVQAITYQPAPAVDVHVRHAYALWLMRNACMPITERTRRQAGRRRLTHNENGAPHHDAKAHTFTQACKRAVQSHTKFGS